VRAALASLAIAASLSACGPAAPIVMPGIMAPPVAVAPPPVPVLPAVSASLARAQAAYDRLRPAAMRALPFLPEPYASRARIALDATGAALAAARQATTLAEQLAEVRRADGLAARLGALIGT